MKSVTPLALSLLAFTFASSPSAQALEITFPDLAATAGSTLVMTPDSPPERVMVTFQLVFNEDPQVYLDSGDMIVYAYDLDAYLETGTRVDVAVPVTARRGALSEGGTVLVYDVDVADACDVDGHSYVFWAEMAVNIDPWYFGTAASERILICDQTPGDPPTEGRSGIHLLQRIADHLPAPRRGR